MSRVVVTAVGYVGDIAPFIEPARRLAAAGHDVVVVAPAGYRALLAEEPFAFAPYPVGDLSTTAMHADPHHERLLRHPILNSPRLARYYINGYFSVDPEGVANGWRQLLDGAGAVVSAIAPAPVVVPIAKDLGVRSVVGTVVPMIIPTARRHSTFTPWPRNLGRVGNRLSWLYADFALHATYAGPALNRLRVECGLPKSLAPGAHGYRDADRLVALAPEAFAGPGFDDWPSLVWGGFSRWSPSGMTVPDDVEDFLNSGAPPIVVTLGSSAAGGAEARFATIAKAITDLGHRALIVTGTEQLRAATQVAVGATSSVLCAAFVPLEPVVARSRAAVISGSLGSVGVALHAGKPTVVVPSLFDQGWNGRRIQQLGLGRRATTPRAVHAAIATVTTDRTYADRAAAMAEEIRYCDGAQALTEATLGLLAPA
ncbi:MAG: rhamnosyltransferase subunit [Actinomycetota bacterium]|jgi:UDP:flavonoid glycosyltransferase YjiC (YdhE family)